MSVRAKFRVGAKNATEGNGDTIYLTAVTGTSEENNDFFKWTPAGQITLSTVNDRAAAEFEVGKEYYVDFLLAEAAPVEEPVVAEPVVAEPVVAEPVVAEPETASKIEDALTTSLEQAPGDPQASTQTETPAE